MAGGPSSGADEDETIETLNAMADVCIVQFEASPGVAELCP